MKCPVCPDSVLAMSERQGVEIDYCPSCRGVWLDRGELDKLIQLSSSQQASAPASRPAAAPIRHDERPDYARHHQHEHGKHHDGGYRKKNWLSEIFD